MPLLLTLSLLLASCQIRADAIADARAAQTAAAAGDFDRAERLYSRAITSGEFDAGNLAVAYYNRGLARQRQNDFYRAIEDYSAALALNPGRLAALYNRALAYAELGATGPALEDLGVFLGYQPDTPQALLQRARLLADSGRPAAARQDLDRALELAPDDPQLWAASARLRGERGRVEQA
ncbi:MAG: tetratricopeptide repeat protein, partial [Candidatus Competibacterales bacterium]|nr:tetratricopeptide repeat protein [Candidatus Competibacterales bacterium]